MRLSGAFLAFVCAFVVAPATALAENAKGTQKALQNPLGDGRAPMTDKFGDFDDGLGDDVSLSLNLGHYYALYLREKQYGFVPRFMLPEMGLEEGTRVPPAGQVPDPPKASPATAVIPGKGSRSDGKTSASFAVYSNLVWRGQALTTGVSIQTMVDLAWKTLGFNIWSNYDVDLGYISETDLTLNYAGAHNKLGYNVGVIYYGLRTPTTELYLSLDYDVVLAPYVSFYWDVDAGQGGFLILGIGHAFAVTDDIAIELGANVSVNFDNASMGVDENGRTFTDFYNMSFTAQASIPFAGAWSFDMILGYSFALTDASKSGISSASATGENSLFWGGVGVALSF